jgi:alpha-D-ribose 1-methylphosphonate 5-phosphate C-P lyase
LGQEVNGEVTGAVSREYNFAYLDEDTKREIRRALLKAVAIPGYQVPFAGREMPMPYGWGTGGIQITASIIGPKDTLKVIDQGSDDTTNAVSIRTFFEALTGVETTGETGRASIIQTRHRIPETALSSDQIMVYQVPLPEPMRHLEPSEPETRSLHALFEYGLMYLKLYEDVTKHKEITISYDYPVLVFDRYAMSPSPIPRFDNPKLNGSKALHLFGAGRERRVYAIPPHTKVKSFDFSDHPFRVQSWEQRCAICGADDSYLDEIVQDDQGNRMFVCSDSDHCQKRLKAQNPGLFSKFHSENNPVMASKTTPERALRKGQPTAPAGKGAAKKASKNPSVSASKSPKRLSQSER